MKKAALFETGKAGYNGFRIPSLLRLTNNRIIAFIEGRLNDLSDHDTIRILCKISYDNGESFSDIITVADNFPHTLSNPCAVYDEKTDTIHMLLNGNLKNRGEDLILKGEAKRSIFYITSRDGGKTWSELRDITDEIAEPNWTWIAFGPCHAEKLSNGRLIFPCNHAYLPENKGDEIHYYSHCVYSDDEGKTWQVGQNIARDTNECSLAVLDDGRLYMNMRSYHKKGLRAQAYSDNNGESFYGFSLNEDLTDPVCQGSTLNFKRENGENILLFSNAADAESRIKLTVKASLDEGKTFRKSLVLHEGHAAYSDLIKISDKRVGCLYECGVKEHAYEKIIFSVFDIDDIK